jgi:glutaredoxin
VRTVTVFVRDGCHLCEEALAVLERLRAAHPFAIEQVDIEADDALHRRYLERIPVVAIGGEELSDFFVDEAAVLARVRSGRG